VAIQRVWDDNDQPYGPRKIWKQLRRDGHRLALHHRAPDAGHGVERRQPRTGVGRHHARDVAADRTADLVDRCFVATRPNQLWIADFTYVATWRGFVYVAFVIDVFARRIVGWCVSAPLRTDFALDALE
jgi:putative transposase